EGEPSFVPPQYATKAFPGDWYGRTLHFGIREHGMGAILNGIVLHGGTRPFGGTFLVFSDYMRPAVRLAALMKLPVVYVWTHDSIVTRVASIPCREWCDAQDLAYRRQVLPTGVKPRVSVEAGIAMSWRDLIGDCGESVSIEHYGASAPYQVLFEQFGFTPDHVAAAARASLARVGAITGTTTGN